MNKFYLVPIIVVLSVLPLRAQNGMEGSLIVTLVSNQGDYVVVGSESRQTDRIRHISDDNGCKIVSLGKGGLFFESGHAIEATPKSGTWKSLNEARAIFRSSKDHSGLGLASAWGDKAQIWFSKLPAERLLQMANNPNGIIVTGGFVAVDKDVHASVWVAVLSYDKDRKRLFTTPFNIPAGKNAAVGVAMSVAREFLDASTARALKAGAPPTTGIDVGSDLITVQKTIEFTIANAAPEEKTFLGGEIDLAVFRKDGTVTWMARKSSCYREDLSGSRP